jgi:GT2 family glycosyltransferase
MTTMSRSAKTGSGSALTTSFQWQHERSFSGYVVDAADLNRKFVVELLIDGLPVKCALAADRVRTLAERDIGDGHYGFTFALSANTLCHAEIVEARIANIGAAVGEPVRIQELSIAGPNVSSPGVIRWLGGLRFSGWLAEGTEHRADIFVDDEQIMQARPSGWSHVGDVENPRAVRALDFHLPECFADGNAHRVAALTTKGESLEGSPLPFVAFTNGFEQARRGIAPIEELRESILDRLIPMSIPFAAYHRWRDRLPKPVADPQPLRAAIIGVGTGEMDDTLASLNAQDHVDWVAASLPGYIDCAGFDSRSALDFLAGEGSKAEFVVFLLSGTILETNAIMRMSSAFARDRRIVAVYGDVDVAGRDGLLWPMAFPAFDYERMLEQGYCSHLFAMRRPAVEHGLANGANTLYRLFNSLLDEGEEVADKIAHLPGSVATVPTFDLTAAQESLAAATRAHLKRRGILARVEPGWGQVLPAVRVSQNVREAAVTIVIPTRNRRDLLEACIASLQPALSKRVCEIIVVDNESTELDALDYLSSIDGKGARVIRVAGDFNFSRLNNAAASAANGTFLCLLNNDVQAVDDDWLEEMLGRIAAPDVGAIGAMLLWPSGIVQHGGVVLGPNFAATHAFNDRMDGDAGYCDILRVAHQCSAVTAACLLTRRKDYLDVGGMDEFRFPVNFNDVDYCLKLRAAGKRIVFTPHARLRHLESASRGPDAQPDRKARAERELRNLRAKWADVLLSDPFYNPVLSLDPVPFSALAWPLRSMMCRTLEQPKPVNVPPGF